MEQYIPKFALLAEIKKGRKEGLIAFFLFPPSLKTKELRILINIWKRKQRN